MHVLIAGVELAGWQLRSACANLVVRLPCSSKQKNCARSEVVARLQPAALNQVLGYEV